LAGQGNDAGRQEKDNQKVGNTPFFAEEFGGET